MREQKTYDACPARFLTIRDQTPETGRKLAGRKFIGAGDEDRTRNFQLGKLTLYH